MEDSLVILLVVACGVSSLLLKMGVFKLASGMFTTDKN